MDTTKTVDAATDVRERILETASTLFYTQGVRAVGVDLVTEKAGVAKTSLYRHFRTKDDLIAAFVQREDEHFWQCWDKVAQQHADDPAAELDAHCEWIGERVERLNYRGCPQINVAAEFPDVDHPARKVALVHKQQLRSRLKGIADRLGARRADELAGQLALFINGAFVSSQIFQKGEATALLKTTMRTLLAAQQKS
jgi:AcrR family transcriptional regulator